MVSCGPCQRLLHCRFLLNPLTVVLIGHHIKICLHVVVSEAAKLRAHNFILPDFCSCEVQRKIQTGDKVLMNSQLWDEECVSDIFRVHQQMDFAIYGDGHLGSDNVILRVGIMRCIQPKEILVRLIDHVGMSGTKLSVRTGIAEVKRELPSLDLNRHCIGTRGTAEIIEFWMRVIANTSAWVPSRFTLSTDSLGHSSRPLELRHFDLEEFSFA